MEIKEEDGNLVPSIKIIQYNLFDKPDEIIVYQAPQTPTEYEQIGHLNEMLAADNTKRGKAKFPIKSLIPVMSPTEGNMELPMLFPYHGTLPTTLVGLDESLPKGNADSTGMHGCCYDYVLESKLRNFGAFVQRASHYQCALGLDFSVPHDSFVCDAVDALRKNRYATLALQLRGIPTIQTASISNPRFYDFIYDGLAPNAPVAIENNLERKDSRWRLLLRNGVAELIKRKNPTVLLVVGAPLDFDPGVEVRYYESRIQKFRRLENGSKN